LIREALNGEVESILKTYFKDEFGNKSSESPFSKNIVFEDKKIIGVINYDLIYDRIEINHILVLEEYRRNNIASKLVNYLINNNDIKNITLEVNCNNKAAINLYSKLGFVEVSIRKNYYYNGDDAFLMQREIGE